MSDQPDETQLSRNDITSWHHEKPSNFLEADPNIQLVLRMYLEEGYHEHWPRLNRAAGMAATRINELATEISHGYNEPQLERFDPFGTPIENIVFSPAAIELGAHVWSTGVLEMIKEPGHDLLSAGLGYFLAHNGEMGHICPVACTAGLIKLLQAVGSEEQKEQYLHQLSETDFSQRLHASQFVTEIQGGSDVGANSCEARPEPNNEEHDGTLFRLFGEKWFCSVADAGVFVVSARVTGAPDGTKGLGLFLVPRIINGQPNNFSIRRLKDKLGTRSLPTAEMEFQGALAESLGPVEDGFKQLVGIVLDTSRVYNAVAACGIMHRTFLEAQTYAQYRKAFGGSLMGFPLVHRLLGQIKCYTFAAVASTFRLIDLTDRIARGEEDAVEFEGARRVQVMMNKYWTASLCSETVRMGIEVLGGNGTIEDFSPLPRLYRDSIVLENWEGAHNTLCSQVLRDFSERGLHENLFAEMRACLGRVTTEHLGEHVDCVIEALGDMEERLEVILNANADRAAFKIRPWIDRICMINGLLSMLYEYSWELDNFDDGHSDKGTVIQIFRALYVDRQDPLDLDGLEDGMKALSIRF